MSFKSDLNEVNSKLADLEKRARGLRNQHLADLIGHAIGRLGDVANHPDVDNVDRVHDDKKELPPGTEPLNSGGNLMFAAGDPARALQAQESERRASFAHDAANRNTATGEPLVPPSQPIGGLVAAAGSPPPDGLAPGTAAAGAPVSSSDKDAHHPGDPEFRPENNNPGFRNPNDVELNADGTLKSAPNSLGTANDDRDKK